VHRWRSRQILEVRRNFARKNFGPLFVRIFLMKTVFRMTSTKKRSSCDFGCHFFQIKARWAPFSPVSSGSLPRFLRILQRFSQIFRDLPEFSANKNFLGCACTPASYTTATGVSKKRATCYPRRIFVRPAMLFGNFHAINIYVAKCLEKGCLETTEPKLDDTQCSFRSGRSTSAGRQM